MNGMVYLVGAGPGDYRLITLKGKECLEKADVVICDYLADKRLMAFAKDDVEYIYVGKKAGNHAMRQEDISQLIADKAMIVDCSPSLGLLTVNALTAANSVIIPVQCEYFALEGLGKLLNTIKIIQGNLNPDLEIEGFLLTMYDSRLRLSNQVAEEVNKHFQQMVFKTIIQRNVKLSEAPSFGQPAILYDADSRGTVNYLNLAKEIIEKHNPDGN